MSSSERVVAGWILEERLGSGGFGEVWRARRRHAGSARALKLIRIGSQEAFDSWRHEIGRLENLSHPNVVRFYDADVITEPPYDDHAWIATELCTRSLADELSHRPGRRLRSSECEDLLGQMLAALAAAHAGGCVHRDLKPANILWHDSGVWKLCDFGTARLLPKGATHPETRVVGTSPYMSAAAHSGRQDHGADLYALGVTVHEALSGERLHPRPEGMTDTAYAMSILKTPPTLSSDLPGHWTRVVEVLIGRHGNHTAAQLVGWFEETRGASPPRSDDVPTHATVRAQGSDAARGEVGLAAAAAAAGVGSLGRNEPATAATDQYPVTHATEVKRPSPPRPPPPQRPQPPGDRAASVQESPRPAGNPSTLVQPAPSLASPPMSPVPVAPASPPARPAAGGAPPGSHGWAGHPQSRPAVGPYPYGFGGPASVVNGVLWPSPPVTGRRFLALVLDGIVLFFLTYVLLSAFEPQYGRMDVEDFDQASEVCADVEAAGAAQCIALNDRVYVAGETPWRTWLTPVVVGLAMSVVLEGRTGVTPGKLVLGLRTVRADGRPPGLLRALARWLLWIVDALPLCFPLVALIAMSSSRGQRRVGDRAAGTFVVPRGVARTTAAAHAAAAGRR